MNRVAFVAAALVLSLALGGCSSFLSATRNKPINDDRGTRTIDSKIDGSPIETKATVNITKADPALDKDSHIIVVGYNGIMLIAGWTSRADLKSKVEQAARTMQKVRNVHNELQVTSPSSLLARNNGARITTKLKTQMFSDPNVSSSRIRAVVKNGIAYTMDLVNQQEAAQAIRVTQDVGGMQKIIKLFKYIN